MKDTILTPRSRRALDIPGLGSYELVTGQKSSGGSYSKSPWAFSCMQVRATELARLPWRITRNGEAVDSHPLIEMLNQFGQESNYAEAMIASEIDLLMSAAAYWLMDGDILRRLNPNTITVKADRSGIKAFVQTIEGKVVNRFARDEIVYFREHSPDTDLLPGVAVMDVISKAVAVEHEAGLYVEAYFKNDAVPGILLSTDQSVDTIEMDKVKSWWNKQFRGSRNKGKVGFVDKGLKATPLSADLGKQALVEVRDQARQDICVGFRVPEVLLKMSDATFANAQEARKFMLEDVIIPRAEYFAGVLNADLVSKVDPSVEFTFAFEEMELLQEDANAKWDRLNSAIQAQVISVEFARQEMGWPEDAAPDVKMTPEQTDLRAWRRKSLKSLRAGNGASVDFESRHIRPAIRSALMAQLDGATTSGHILGVFDGVR